MPRHCRLCGLTGHNITTCSLKTRAGTLKPVEATRESMTGADIAREAKRKEAKVNRDDFYTTEMALNEVLFCGLREPIAIQNTRARGLDSLDEDTLLDIKYHNERYKLALGRFYEAVKKNPVVFEAYKDMFAFLMSPFRSPE